MSLTEFLALAAAVVIALGLVRSGQGKRWAEFLVWAISAAICAWILFGRPALRL